MDTDVITERRFGGTIRPVRRWWGRMSKRYRHRQFKILGRRFSFTRFDGMVLPCETNGCQNRGVAWRGSYFLCGDHIDAND